MLPSAGHNSIVCSSAGLRFTADSGVRHPQTEWHAKQSAQNLISVANSIFKPALIQ